MNLLRNLMQLTLDLFDAEPQQPAASPAKPKKESKQPLKVPESHDRQAQAAINNVANSGPVPAPFKGEFLNDVVTPANFRHPKANRESRLCNAMVAYEFKRGRRRTIGFVVGAEGLVVSAPKWVPLHEVESALQEKAAWIVKKLGETRERHERLESSRIEWHDGTLIPFLGEQVIVVLDPRHDFSGVGAMLQTGDSSANLTLAGVPHLTLHVALPHSATPEQIRDAVQAWLMRQAKRIFTERLNHFAQQLNVTWLKLSLSSAGTRWGSASSSGAIRLNWRLVHFKQDVIDYVVAHELSHLRVMDHSPRFWDTVRTVVPDYAQLRSQLKDDAIPKWN
jgi:predicted metal-dependent hydrolase